VADGKRAGARRGARPPRTFTRRALLLAVGITLAVVAWGYLVYAAIDFGTSARAGRSAGWWLLGLASLGAVACLFLALMLVVRLLRELGIVERPEPPEPKPTRVPGGRRAAR
jgi:RsiW-degrading membrane proteinase PrsW (M82 family)